MGLDSEVMKKEGASPLSRSSAVSRRGRSGGTATPVGIPTTQWSFPWNGEAREFTAYVAKFTTLVALDISGWGPVIVACSRTRTVWGAAEVTVAVPVRVGLVGVVGVAAGVAWSVGVGVQARWGTWARTAGSDMCVKVHGLGEG